MIKAINDINAINNRINLKIKEIGYERDSKRKLTLQSDLNVLKLKREIAVIRKKIKQLEG